MPRRTKKPRRLSKDAARGLLNRAADLYLHACYGTGTPARADEFAAWLRLARPHLSQLVPKLVGMSVHDFLRSQQLAHAQHLLRTTLATVQAIAIHSGFGTESTLRRCFRAAFGITPAKYREQETTE